MFALEPPNVEEMKARRDAQGLIRMLGHEKETVRQAAAEALIEISLSLAAEKEAKENEDFFQRLLQAGTSNDEALIPPPEDEKAALYEAAIRALGKIRATVIPQLLTALTKPQKRRYAAQILEQIGWQPDPDENSALYWMAKGEWDRCATLGSIAIAPLLLVLQEQNNEARRAAAHVLGQIGDARAVEPLLALLVDKDPKVRQAAVEALGQIADPRAVETLETALQDRDGSIRLAAIKALGKIGGSRAVEVLIDALRGRFVHRLLLEELAKMKSEDAQQIAALLRSWDENSAPVHLRLRQTLKEASHPFVVHLLTTILTEGKDERASAVEALGRIGDPRAVGPLIVALKDEDESVRKAAAEALGHIRDSRAIEPLIAALKDSNMRKAAVEALVNIGAPAVEPLIAALKERGLRWSAAEALGKIGDARAVEPLSETLRDWGLRWAAAEALAKIGVPAVEPLTAALKDEDHYVRWAAAEALISVCRREELEDKTKAEILTLCDKVTAISDDRYTRKLQAQEDVEELIRALIHPDVKVRVVARFDAIQALGALGDRRAWSPLITCLQDPRPVIRQIVLEALIRIDAQEAVPFLIEALQDSDREVGKAAARHLVALYHEGRLPEVARQAILECRPMIVQHHDAMGQNQWGCHLHQDEGLGVEFPL